MNAALPLACPECGRALPEDRVTAGGPTFCPRCTADFEVAVFPALASRPVPAKADAVGLGADAACFFHAQNQAVAVCETCGRFLCAVCRVDYGGRILCAECIGGRSRTAQHPENQRVVYASIALSLAFFSLLFWPLTIITAPCVIWLVFWGWRKPGSLVRPARWRFVVAGLLAIAQISGWVVFLLFRVFHK